MSTSTTQPQLLKFINERATGATHVWVIIAHGLSAGGSSNNGFADLPNFRTIQRLGVYVRQCHLRSSDPSDNLRSLLLHPDPDDGLPGPSLSQLAADAGRQVVHVLPWRQDRWIAEHTEGNHWSIIEASLDHNTIQWEDLLNGRPQFISNGRTTEEDSRYFQQRVIGRFPGPATRAQEVDAISAWMEWVSDAFLRSVWYASARSDSGVFGLLTFPAPGLLSHHYGHEGYDFGLELFDELLGRLLLLRGNPEMADSILVVCGDHDPTAGEEPPHNGNVPLVITGPQYEDGLSFAEAAWEEVALILRRLVQQPVQTQ